MALTPDAVTRLTRAGHRVLVERQAGAAAAFPDGAYAEAGAEMVEQAAAWSAPVVATVRGPSLDDRGMLTDDSLVLGLLEPLTRPRDMAELAATGITAAAFELLPRTTRAQSMDVLSSQATVAGYQAVLVAAARLDRFFPMLTTAAGTIPPARVLVLGAGVAGLQAIATARRLGARVKAFDVRAAAREQVESLGADFIEIDIAPQDASATGGYARELEESSQEHLLAELRTPVSDADAVITAAAIPGRPAPLLVTRDMVERMRPGAVIVDGAAATGGNCELSVADEVVVENGVTIVAPTDLESRVPADASRMYARNVLSLLEHVAPEGEPALDFDDEITAGVVVTHGGRVVHPRVAALLEEG